MNIRGRSWRPDWRPVLDRWIGVALASPFILFPPLEPLRPWLLAALVGWTLYCVGWTVRDVVRRRRSPAAVPPDTRWSQN